MLDSFTRQNVIGRLRVAGTNVDALSARLRAERLLNAADLEAAQPTPSAIVFIRKLRDPLPGVLSLDSSATEPPAEWKAALTSALRSVTGRAGRPAVESVSGNEEAIIFADRAELLACLAADTCHGATATRWWWTCLLRGGHDLHAIKKIWRESPEYIPAALRHLSKRGEAATFVQRLDDDTSYEFIRAITNVFGLEWLMPVVGDRVVTSLSHDASTPASVVGPGKELLSAPPWAVQVSDTAMHQLSLEQQRFLGVALMIQQAPAVVRAREFARAVEQWQEQVVMRTADQLLQSSTRPRVGQQLQTAGQSVSSPLPGVHPTPEPASHIAKTDESRIKTPRPPAVGPLASMTAESPESISPEVVVGPFPDSSHAMSDNFAQSDTIQADTVPEVPSLTTAQLTDQSTFEVSNLNDNTDPLSIETDLGGLLYLINLGVYLNLYSDFSAPLAPGIELNIWDFVALVGSELVEGSHADDPIWAMLAILAGRDETQPPGMNFESENNWRLPPECLLPFEEDERCKWETSRNRLRVGPTLDRWLSWLMPYLRARLRVALGLKTNAEIPGTLCRHYARVSATDTHVDVYFSLADLPLAIRFAGLDRDPGWVPAAGRFISFHFD